jgi:cation diffusion facilitator CzcD-associated flavoprotein CzcO
MSETSEAATPFDPETVRAKYLAERDRRLVEGRSAIRDLTRDEFFAAFRNDPFTPVVPREPCVEELDVAIIGAGMAGLVTGAKLRDAGVERMRLIDEAGGVGGAWYWNQYPGVMCDVESYIYMPMLEELDYVPTTKYAFGEEIRQHFEAIARKYDLLDGALLHTRVQESVWDESARRWVIRTDRGDVLRAKYLVLAVGILNLMKLPAIPGMEKFQGPSFHTARWDYDVTGGGPDGNLSKLADKVVAVMGTGASAIQCVPHVAAAAKHLYVFQRTPSAIGVRGNHPTEPGFAESLGPGWQWERMLNFQRAVSALPVDVDLVDDGWTHHWGPARRPPGIEGLAPEDVARRIEEFDFEIMEEHRSRVDELVHDPVKSAILKPYYRYLCKRPCFHDEYLQSFNLPNVTLVDCPAGIAEVTERGLVVDDQQYEVDCIIYATGFEGETTPLARRAGHEVVGRDGVTLASRWDAHAASLFGMMSHGFPNMFILPAPGQQAVVTANHTLITVVGAEHVGKTVEILDEAGVEVFDVTEAAEADWCDQIRAGFVDATAMLSACTPSRLNNEGNPAAMKAENGSYGGGLGDFFGFVELLEQWRTRLAAGEAVGLDLDRAPG